MKYYTKYILQETKQAATRQGSLWTSVSHKILSRLVKNLLHSFLSCPRKSITSAKKAVPKNRIFHTCSKSIYSHSIVKSYSTYSHSIVKSYSIYSRQSVVHRSSVGRLIVISKSGYTKLISFIYVHIPFDNLKPVPQYFPRSPPIKKAHECKSWASK